MLSQALFQISYTKRHLGHFVLLSSKRVNPTPSHFGPGHNMLSFTKCPMVSDSSNESLIFVVMCFLWFSLFVSVLSVSFTPRTTAVVPTSVVKGFALGVRLSVLLAGFNGFFVAHFFSYLHFHTSWAKCSLWSLSWSRSSLSHKTSWANPWLNSFSFLASTAVHPSGDVRQLMRVIRLFHISFISTR